MYVPSSELGFSHPLPRQRLCPSPQNQGGGFTLACGSGVGGVPISTTGEKLSTLPTLWMQMCPAFAFAQSADDSANLIDGSINVNSFIPRTSLSTAIIFRSVKLEVSCSHMYIGCKQRLFNYMYTQCDYQSIVRTPPP